MLTWLPVIGFAETHSWVIPVEGNAYITHQSDGSRDGIHRRGGLTWADMDTAVSVFFRVNRPSELDLALRLKVSEGVSKIHLSHGDTLLTREVEASEVQDVKFGKIRLEQEGYVRLALLGKERTGPVFAELSDVLVSSAEPGLELAYVREPGGNRFYWGRRGPSVHLGYSVPTEKPIEWFYSEITVPEGEDPVGSYFMANGFREGYFGIQVNSEQERRVLFSIWSPFHTDDPSEVPQEDRIIVLNRGDDVYTGEFGNEGSGGQSFLVFPWKAGTTYGFLTQAHPDGDGSTIYTAWFHAPEEDGWQLIASFKRPKTETYLTRLHSFLENFNPAYGHHARRAWHGNQWVRDGDGEWHEITEARFTGDDIARRGYRLDFAGGAEGARFFLKNGGFFDDTVALDGRFQRNPAPEQRPNIAFDALE
ncbi:MAG: DUF3472 domain-containing protein [Opitutales bacterium]